MQEVNGSNPLFSTIVLVDKDSELNTPHSWFHTRQNDLWHVVTDKTVEKKISIQLKVWASVVYAFPQGEIYIDTGEESKKGRMADA